MCVDRLCLPDKANGRARTIPIRHEDDSNLLATDGSTNDSSTNNDIVVRMWRDNENAAV
jgi:hypothetical protein